MARRKLSELLNEATNEKKPSYWHARLNEMLVLLKEKKYMALERRIKDLLESDMVTGRQKTKETQAQRHARIDSG
jgi:hypothetical protein